MNDSVKKFRETVGYRAAATVIKVSGIELKAHALPDVEGGAPSYMVRISRNGRGYTMPHTPFEEDLKNWRQSNPGKAHQEYVPDLTDLIISALAGFSMADKLDFEAWSKIHVALQKESQHAFEDDSDDGIRTYYDKQKKEARQFKSVFSPEEYKYLETFMLSAQAQLLVKAAPIDISIN